MRRFTDETIFVAREAPRRAALVVELGFIPIVIETAFCPENLVGDTPRVAGRVAGGEAGPYVGESAAGHPAGDHDLILALELLVVKVTRRSHHGNGTANQVEQRVDVMNAYLAQYAAIPAGNLLRVKNIIEHPKTCDIAEFAGVDQPVTAIEGGHINVIMPLHAHPVELLRSAL